MDTLLQDLRYALRMLAKRPGFTLAAITTLAIGIGLNTAIFSVVNSVLLRPLPYKAPERLVQVWETYPGSTRGGASPNNFLDWSKQAQAFEQLAASQLWGFSLTGISEPTEVFGMKVTTNFFALLGVAPQLGRAFSPDDDRAENSNSVVISHELWQRDFGGSEDILGKTIRLDDVSYTIIGVMPKDFRKTDTAGDYEAELWTPLVINAGDNLRGNHFLRVIGRLKDGVTIEQAQSELSSIAGQLAEAYPATNTDRGVNIIALHEQVTGNIRLVLILLQCAVGFVLLIACANVANLLLARIASREREMAIRLALGAGRARLVRLLLTESLLLAAIGGGIGVLLATWGIDLLVAIAPQDIPRLDEISLDRWAFGFTAALSLLTILFFGLIPAWQAAKININEALKDSSRATTRGHGLRGMLVVAEVALTLVLLVGAGLLLRSLNQLQNVDLGFNPENVLMMRVSLLDAKYPDRLQVGRFYEQAVAGIEALPGVESASVSSSPPMIAWGNTWFNFEIVGQPSDPGRAPTTYYRQITPGYFQTMAIPLRAGRAFNDRDTGDAPLVAIINEAFARRHFPDTDPIGKKITLGRTTREIVGVVGNVRHRSLEQEPDVELYVPHAQNPRGTVMMVIRTASDPDKTAALASKVIWAADSDAAVSNVATMNQALSGVVSRPRFNTILLSIFSVVALVLASIGIYGVVSYTVAQSTRELGIRVALGAQSSHLLKLVMGQGLVLGASGIAIGIVGALGLTQLMKRLLFGVEATDPTTFVSVALLLIAVVMLACHIPARRATRVDPMEALRYE